jgi:hypothetical protein
MLRFQTLLDRLRKGTRNLLQLPISAPGIEHQTSRITLQRGGRSADKSAQLLTSFHNAGRILASTFNGSLLYKQWNKINLKEIAVNGGITKIFMNADDYIGLMILEKETRTTTYIK